MSKLNRSAQARINGAKSKGPKTQLGKFIAAANSFKTGLHAAKSAALKLENSDEYDGQLAAYIRRYQPQDAVELNYVRELCCLDWRIHRFKVYETAVLNHQVEVQDKTLQATDVRVPDDLKGAIAVEFMNKNSNVIRFLAHQGQALASQRLAVLRSFRETREFAPVLLPGFYLTESEEVEPDLNPENEPKEIETPESLKEAA